MSDIIKAEQGEAITAGKVNEFLTAFGIMPKLSAEEKAQCIAMAIEFRLNPFKREIHFVKYGGQAVSIVVGYDVFIKRAERTSKLDGWRAWVEGTGADMVAKIEIHRKDWSRPFFHEVYFPEVKGAGPLWVKAPRMMIKKVVIGQGFRMCFPDELGGLPYFEEEAEAIATDNMAAKKPTDEEVDEAVKAAGAKVKAWIAKDKALRPENSANRGEISKAFMAFVTAKDTAGAVKYAEGLPVHAEPADIETISEIFDGEVVDAPQAGEPEPKNLEIF